MKTWRCIHAAHSQRAKLYWHRNDIYQCLFRFTSSTVGDTIYMTQVRRAGYVFVSWVGDHPPRHIHIYQRGKLVAKYDLESREVMKGRVSSKLRKVIAQLQREGVL